MNRSILMVNTVRGFVGGVERYLFQVASILRSNHWDVHGLFEQNVHSSTEFDKVFSSIEVVNHDDISKQIDYYLEVGVDIVFFHKVTRWHWVRQLQERFRSVCMIHDHDYYCLRKHKYFPYKRINCSRKFSLVFCLVCSGLIEKVNGKFKLIDVSQKMLLLEMMKKCSYSFVLSEYMRSNLIQNGWNEHKIKKLIPVQEYGLDIPPKNNRIPLIIYCGQLIRGKGVDLLIQALALLNNDFKCSIIGRGNDEQYLRSLVDCNGLTGRVTFEGWSDNINEWYDKADLIVIPSRWQEPFGLIGIEALAHKVPVIAFNVGGISEWLKHKKNGLLVPQNNVKSLASSIDRLLSDKDTPEKYGNDGYQYVAMHYNQSCLEKKLFYYFDKLIPADEQAT